MHSIRGLSFILCIFAKKTRQLMERIELSKSGKQVFRLLDNGVYTRPDYISPSDFNNGARELRNKGLAVCHEEEGGDVIISRLTDMGKRYSAFNPSLSNPIDWKWIISTAIGLISLAVAIIALFVACTEQG